MVLSLLGVYLLSTAPPPDASIEEPIGEEGEGGQGGVHEHDQLGNPEDQDHAHEQWQGREQTEREEGGRSTAVPTDTHPTTKGSRVGNPSYAPL
jgi:hypothetical protein